jgi:hypothetical protein
MGYMAELLKLAEQQNACWKGYTQVGMKMKGGREVPNCVPAGGVPKPKAKKTEKKSFFALDSDPDLSEEERRLILAAKKIRDKAQRSGSFYVMPIEDLLKEDDAEKKSAVSGMDSIVDAPIRCTPGFGCKRYLTPQERVEVEAAKRKMFPDYLATAADPISSQMSSPEWAGIGTGLLGALLGGGVGAGAGSLAGMGAVPGGAGGALVGALLGGLYGHGSRTRTNKTIEDTMEDLPVGADLGDIEVYSDPRFRQQLARDFQRQLMRKGLM